MVITITITVVSDHLVYSCASRKNRGRKAKTNEFTVLPFIISHHSVNCNSISLPPVDPSGNSFIDHDGVNVPVSPPKITTPPPLPQKNDVQDGASASNTPPHIDTSSNNRVTVPLSLPDP